MVQRFTLKNSRGDVVVKASSRELNPTSETWLDGTPSGWYGGYSMRGEDTENIDWGDFSTHRTPSARSLELRVHVHRATWEAANAEKRRLSAALVDGEVGELRGEESGVPALTAYVERKGEILFARQSPNSFTASIPLKAPDPRLYSDELKVFLHPVGLGRGLEYPLFAKSGVLTYGTALAERDSITNGGDATAYDSYLIVGDFPGGWRLTVGRKVIEWPWPTVLTAPVLVEMTGRIWIGDSNVTDQASVRQWAPLAPGATVTPSLTPLQGGTGWAEVRHRDTYI